MHVTTNVSHPMIFFFNSLKHAFLICVTQAEKNRPQEISQKSDRINPQEVTFTFHYFSQYFNKTALKE